MPGEFEPHEGCWMLWPQRPDNWRLGGKPAQKAFVEVAKAISQFEPVTVGVNENQYENCRGMMPDGIRVVEMSNDDSWIRDCGATFVKNNATGEVRGVDWRFNAWGGLVDGLYFPWLLDDEVARKMIDMERKDGYRLADFVLEGGSIHSDGDGTVMVTEECLLSEGRNPDMSKAEITDMLCSYLGADKVLWLKRGIYLDETNGHVDNICCFVKPGKVLLAWTDDESDPQYEISKENLEYLESETDAKGRKLEIVKLYVPKPILITKEEEEGVDAVDGTLPRLEGDRLAASYVNFLIVNGGVILPAFGDPNDEKAVQTVKACFPDREVAAVYAREILLGGGNVHCITQQQPAAKK
jgi:agmatine deiminase